MIVCPNRANDTITPNDTRTAWPASRLRRPFVSDAVRPRKIGTVPSGSMITISVMKTSPNRRGSKTPPTSARAPVGAPAVR